MPAWLSSRAITLRQRDTCSQYTTHLGCRHTVIASRFTDVSSSVAAAAWHGHPNTKVPMAHGVTATHSTMACITCAIHVQAKTMVDSQMPGPHPGTPNQGTPVPTLSKKFPKKFPKKCMCQQLFFYVSFGNNPEKIGKTGKSCFNRFPNATDCTGSPFEWEIVPVA